MVTILMFYRRRALPKHRYDMTEVEYGGGGTAHGWERSTDQLVCLEVPPAPVYKGARGRLAGPIWAHQEEESSS